MKDKIIVIGGYGQVGKIICQYLADYYPGRVMAAGRNLSKATQFSRVTNGKVLPLEIDIYNLGDSMSILNDAYLVIMCLDQKDTTFIEKCIECKVHYIDISPSYRTLSKIELLHNRATENEVTLLIGTGLAPGLVNLLAKHVRSSFDYVNEAETFLLLGLGEKHGKDGINWLINNLREDFYVLEDNVPSKVKSFSDGKKTLLTNDIGERTAYRFDLAEQHILTKTLGIKYVSSRFCYDSSFVTNTVALLNKIGAFKIYDMKLLRNLSINILDYLLTLFDKLNLWTKKYAIKITMKGFKDNKEKIVEYSISGINNSEVTGITASIVADQLISENLAKGVYYIEQIFEFEDVFDLLKRRVDLKFERLS